MPPGRLLPWHSPIPIRGTPAALWATLAPSPPGALTSSDAPQHWGFLCPSAALQDLWMIDQDQPLYCLEGPGGLPLLWEQCTMLLELILLLPEAPRGSCSCSSSLPGNLPAPIAQVPLDSPAWCCRGLLVRHVPVSPRGCSLVMLWRLCPACALNFCHTSPLSP